jgi:chemotaxis protein MotB
MSDDEQQQPIIIKKINKIHGGHHGGAWKVAFADFMTAMMAFFLVLWLVGQDPEIKKSVAGYFKDPVGFDRGGKMGSGKGAGLMQGQTGMMDKTTASSVIRKRMKEAAESIMQNLMLSDEFKGLRNNVQVELTAEGLRIQIIEGGDSSFFESGSARMSPTGEAILGLIGQEVRKLPNRIIYEGHTDASGSSNLYGYSNWDLGADRANFTRKVMLRNGVRSSQVKEVRSYGSTKLLYPEKPNDPNNRRVSILVLNDYDYVLEHNLLDTSFLGSTESEDSQSEPARAEAKTDKSSDQNSRAQEVEDIDESSFELPDYLKDTSGAE